ncbi:hypothetical protein BANRA_03802 [Acinetobacter baumannii]|nr:hypothetical protein BANRA_03802 [Acinetobacter baumannii]
MEKYEYLAEHVLEIMQLSDSERIETLFTDRWIGYKKAHSIVNKTFYLLYSMAYFPANW